MNAWVTEQRMTVDSGVIGRRGEHVRGSGFGACLDRVADVVRRGRWKPAWLLIGWLGMSPWVRGEEGPILLTEDVIRNLGVETANVEVTEFEETVFALGRIRVAAGRRAFVSSRVAGRAIRVDAHIDTRVEKDDPLVVVESRLPGDPPPQVVLKAPMSGLVSEVKVALGQPVSPDLALIEILDLAEVHAVAAVPEHLSGKLKIGARARLRLPARPDRTFEAELAHFGAEVDPNRGTLEAAFHVENRDGELRPGMRCEFSIVVGRRSDVVTVPRQAVQGNDGNRVVFVKVAGLPNGYLRMPVVTGESNDRWTEILDGVKPGDEVVTRGAYGLSFAGGAGASLKEALDAAHGHEHNEDGSEKTTSEAHNHDHDDNHDDDHEHDHDDAHAHDHDQDKGDDHATRGGAGDSGARGPNFWTMFFAGTTVLLLVLLVLSGLRAGVAVGGRGGDRA